MSRRNFRYGTFYESRDSSRTELMYFDDEQHKRQRDAISEINLSYVLDASSHEHHQDWIIRNRLPLLYASVLNWLSDKGNLGIVLTLNVTIIGIFMMSVTTLGSSWRILAQYLVSCGMFGVFGGLTNWIALKILFIKIPGIYGSGVFARCDQDIIRSLRKILLYTICHQSFLESYSEQKVGQYIVAFDVEKQLQQILDSETVEQIINKELHALSQSCEGQMLAMIGIRTASLKPLVRPFIVNVSADVIPKILETLNEKDTTALTVKQEIIRYLSQEGARISSTQVTQFVRVLIYRHLNWLVITGCTVGFFMGIISQITSIARLL